MIKEDAPINSENWIYRIKESDTYIKDMLGYFNEGWEARADDDQQKLELRIKANLLLTYNYVTRLLKELLNLKSTASSAFIKINNAVSQSVLITVPTEKYISDRFLNIYTLANHIEKDSRSESYDLRINFTFDDGKLDEDILKGDGYYKSHSLKKTGK